MLLHAKYASRSELLLQNDIWRSVIVPANYSLFQLHMILLEVFQLIESKETTHGFRLAKAIYPEHGITRFQLVHPEMIAQGSMKEIAHGVYIDRSQCRGSDSNADLVRIVRDDQVYRLDDHFFVSPLLVYEYGMAYEPTQEITIECKHIFTSARPTKTPRAVAGAGQMDGSLSGKRLDVEMLQAAFQRAHRPHGDTERGRAQSEEDVHEAWLYNRDRSMDNLPSLLSHATCNLAAFEEGERLCQPFMA
ncbi:unnamed protein product [Umbelopsis vinacea]